MTLSSIQGMKKEALATELTNRGVDPAEVSNLSRTAMVEKLKSYFTASAALDNAQPEVEKPQTGIVVEVASPEVKTTKTAVADAATPTPLDLEWTKYVLDQMDESEKFEKYPTCDGLLRIFEILIGEITNIHTEVKQAAELNNNNRATVVVTMEYYKDGRTYSVSDAADCSIDNTAHPYCLYPSATASTMALGRCLRKAMRLKTLVKEEVIRPEDSITKGYAEAASNASGISDVQKNMISKLCKGLGIDQAKLLQWMSGSEYTGTRIAGSDLFRLGYNDAQCVMRQLQNYNKDDGEIIPEAILVKE